MSESNYQNPYESQKIWLSMIYKELFNCTINFSFDSNQKERVKIYYESFKALPFSNNTPWAAYRDKILVIKLQNHLLDDPIYS